MKNLGIEVIEKEIEELNRQLSLIDEIIGQIQRNISSDEISFGSRVLIKWERGDTTEGRVVTNIEKDGSMLVHRDGYVGTIRLGRNKEELSKHSLVNLSVGTLGKLEKQQWILTSKINVNKNRIKEIIEKKEICPSLISSIIKTESFRLWYLEKRYDQSISYSDLLNFPFIINEAFVKEYYEESSKDEILQLMEKYNVIQF